MKSTDGETELIEYLNKILNQHSTIDREFPIEMRVNGLVNRYRALSLAYEQLALKLQNLKDKLRELAD